MHLHEYQAKKILSQFGIASPEFEVATSLEEARAIVKRLNLKQAVVKAQVHANSRAYAGGVVFANNEKEISAAVRRLLGTRVGGFPVHRVMITQIVAPEQEYYVGAMIDRLQEKAFLLLSRDGGVAIEDSEDVLGLTLPLEAHDMEQALEFMGWGPDKEIFLRAFIHAFEQTDALLLEINPLSQEMLALDVKMTVDDHALFRQQEIAQYEDPTQLSTAEALAKRHGLSYIDLPGNIGCIVNGSGLAMATMDIIDYFGGAPANFLDVGGSAAKEKIAAGLWILMQTPGIKAILINIFWGMADCKAIAEAILEVIGKKTDIPLIVRMEGINSDKGKYLLLESRLNIILADDLKDAAKKAIIAAGLI